MNSKAHGGHMSESSAFNLAAALQRIRAQATTQQVRITLHAQQEMVEESISLDEVLESIVVAQILEDYPEHRRGPCCLLNGKTEAGRPLHTVCTATQQVLIIITVYEPRPPKWATPTQRRQQA